MPDDLERRCPFCGMTAAERVREWEGPRTGPRVVRVDVQRGLVEALLSFRGYPICFGCWMRRESLDAVVDKRHAELKRAEQEDALEGLRASDAARAGPGRHPGPVDHDDHTHSAEQPTTPAAGSAQDVPKRPTYLVRWKATWRLVKGRVEDKGQDPVQLSQWLEAHHYELACKPETLAKIIRSGLNGNLD